MQPDPTVNGLGYPLGVFRWRSHGTRSGTCGGTRVSAVRVDDLGDPVGPDPGFHPFRGGASRGAPVDDRGAARRRPAPHPGCRGGTGRRVLVMLVCCGGPGPVTVPQGRQLHRRHGLGDRLDQSGGGVGHHPGPADGLAVHRGGVRRRPTDDRGTGCAVPAFRALETHRRCPSPGRSGADRSMEGHGGISFGGVIVLISAALLILPILNIYRKYYGTRMMLTLLGTFYAAMVAAGYLVELIFGTANLIPTQRAATVMQAAISWNYTTWLDIIFLVVAASLVVRFVPSGGIPMVRMMGGSPEATNGHHDHSHQGH